MIFNKLEKKGIANRRKLYQSFVENLPIKNKQYFVCDTEVIGLRVVINYFLARSTKYFNPCSLFLDACC